MSEVFTGLCEIAQRVTGRRGALKIALACGIAAGCLPEDSLPPECQQAAGECNQKYLNCIDDTPAPDQEKKCVPIKEICEQQNSACVKEHAASDGETDATEGGTTDGLHTVTGETSPGVPTTTQDSGGGGMSGGGSGETGESCQPPACFEEGCDPGEPGSPCVHPDFPEFGEVGIVGCPDINGESTCYLHWGGNWLEPSFENAFWCDDFCDGGPVTGTIYNFYCEAFNWDGGACDGTESFRPMPADHLFSRIDFATYQKQNEPVSQD